MSILVIILLIATFFIFGPRPLIFILVAGFAGLLLCNIHPGQEYSWLAGIWHGLFFVPNVIRHFIWDTPFKADTFGTGYNIFFWVFSVISTVGIFLGGSRS